MAPTYDGSDSEFQSDYKRLTTEQRKAFRDARREMVEDLRTDGGFRRRLRVKRVQGTRGVWEMTWAPDGRATFHYGPEQRRGEPHIVWRRIGTHAILKRP